MSALQRYSKDCMHLPKDHHGWDDWLLGVEQVNHPLYRGYRSLGGVDALRVERSRGRALARTRSVNQGEHRESTDVERVDD